MNTSIVITYADVEQKAAICANEEKELTSEKELNAPQIQAVVPNFLKSKEGNKQNEL